ncbi:MAG TPA: GNAT family N-acetyltransferase [Streptosporangiaceae bacterium]|jgi:predicted acetyltransferase
MADPYPIRPFGPDEFNATYHVDEHAFLGRPMSDKHREAYLRQFEFDRSLAAFDGSTPVGVTSIYSLRMSLPGTVAPVAGVTYVAVLPTYRRQGILSSLMRRQLTDISEGDEAVAALWASEPGIYGRYGYGVASWGTSFKFAKGEGVLGRQAPAVERGLRLRLADPGSSRDELGKLFDQVLPTRPGMYARDELWWDRVLGTNNESGAGGDPVRCLLAEDDDGIRGYAIYTATQRWDEASMLPDSTLHVNEMVAVDPAATAAIWRDLLSRDLAGEFTALLRPVDDPLALMLSDLRRARRTLADGLWIRLVDVPRALAQRRYSAPVDVVIKVSDEILPRNAARWRLRTEPGPDGEGDGLAATCEATDSAADLSLDIAALGAAYLGGTQLGGLARAGQVTERRPGTLAAASTALSWDPPPWCPMIF